MVYIAPPDMEQKNKGQENVTTMHMNIELTLYVVKRQENSSSKLVEINSEQK